MVWKKFGMDALSSAGNSLLGIASNAISYDQQKALMRDQQRFAVEMWNRNNEYNTPKAQKERLDAAGINGALAMINGQLGSGNSSSPASSPGAPGVNAPRMDFNPSMAQTYLAQKQQGAIQMDLAAADIKNKEIENKYADLKFWSEAMDFYKKLGLTDEQIRSMYLDNQFKSDTMASRVSQEDVKLGIMMAQENLTNYQSILADLHGQLSQKELQYFDPQMQATIAEKHAHIQLMYVQGELTEKQAEKALWDSWSSMLDFNNKPVWKKEQLDRMVEAELKTAENNTGPKTPVLLGGKISEILGGVDEKVRSAREETNKAIEEAARNYRKKRESRK